MPAARHLLPMTRLWFKARRYGWGWTPVSVEGWAVAALFLALVMAGIGLFVYRILAGADPKVAAVGLILWTLALTGILGAIAWATGERPRWRWGE